MQVVLLESSNCAQPRLKLYIVLGSRVYVSARTRRGPGHTSMSALGAVLTGGWGATMMQWPARGPAHARTPP